MNIDKLPEELLLHVFNYLESTPPSEVKIRHEPSLELTRSSKTTLKDVSTISKRWRRIVLPLLFKHARLRIDIPWRKEWSKCAACSKASMDKESERSTKRSVAEATHSEMVQDFEDRPLSREGGVGTTVSSINDSTTRESFERPNEPTTAQWAWHLPCRARLLRLHH